MANITKLSEGKYLIRVSRGTGSRRRWTNKTFYGTRKDANTRARELEDEADGGTVFKVKGLRFEAYLELWLAAITPRLQPRTVSGYDESIRRYAIATLGDLKLAEVESHHIQAVYAACGKSPTTVRNLHAALNACFAWAVRMAYIRTNPCKHTERPAKLPPDIVVMDRGEAVKFAAHCRETPGGVILEFALETAMRPEEYLALRWRDIRGNDVSVVQAVQFNRKGGGFYFKDVKTKKGRRRIPISERLRLRLVQHRREQNEHRLAMKGTWFNHDLVFPNIIGRPLEHTNVVGRVLKPVLDKCGFDKKVTLYSLRHTCATLLLMAGTNPKIVADRLGHASVVQTLDTYSHVLPHIQDEATDVMDRIMRARG